MTMSRFGILAVTLGCVCVGSIDFTAPAFAHHSFAMFDESKTVPLEGTVKRFEWTNPHSRLYLEVSRLDMAEEWAIELPSTGTLARQGWNPAYIKTGDKIAIRIHPLRDGQPGGTLQSFMCRRNANCWVTR